MEGYRIHHSIPATFYKFGFSKKNFLNGLLPDCFPKRTEQSLVLSLLTATTNGIFLFNLHFLDYDSKFARHMVPVALVEVGIYISGADCLLFREPSWSGIGGVISKCKFKNIFCYKIYH